MTTKHTPGEWYIDADGNVSADDKTVALVYRHNLHAVAGEDDANARLLAAAPEMLEALEALIERARQWPETFAAEVQQAEKAVRKARGGA